MRQALTVVAARKPVVVVMGPIAGSGGYWVATPGSWIVARPGTLTGSIGVLSGKLVTGGLWQKLLFNRETIAFGDHVLLENDERPFSEEERAIRDTVREWVDENLIPVIGEAYVAVESPKGEKGYYMVSDGTSKPVRWRIRPPSFVNLSAIPKMVEGHLLSDVIAINASIDIVMGEIDR